jgi:hypothetical protein
MRRIGVNMDHDTAQFDTVIDPHADSTELARKCLRLIRDIAHAGSCAQSPNDVGTALEDVSQIIFERTGIKGQFFAPTSPDCIPDLHTLYDQLKPMEPLAQMWGTSKWVQ